MVDCFSLHTIFYFFDHDFDFLHKRIAYGVAHLPYNAAISDSVFERQHFTFSKVEGQGHYKAISMSTFKVVPKSKFNIKVI